MARKIIYLFSLVLLLGIIILSYLRLPSHEEELLSLEENLDDKLSQMPPFPYEVYEKWEEVEEPFSYEVEKILSREEFKELSFLIQEKEHEYQISIGESFSFIQEWLKGTLKNNWQKKERVHPLVEKDLQSLKYLPEIKKEIQERFDLFQEIEGTLINWMENFQEEDSKR